MATSNASPPTTTTTTTNVTSDVGRFLLVEVPDFSDEEGQQLSYIRLGAYQKEDFNGLDSPTATPDASPPDPNAPVGKDLLDGVAQADWRGVDGTNTRGGDLADQVNKTGPGDGWVGATGRVFEDDWRTRAGAPGSTYPQALRKQKSAELFKKVGWRDHTDGNRVSTTRGDKVEVIGGNYKLVVLGRQGDPGNAAGTDMSGGHTQDYNAAPGTLTEIRWVKDEFSGTWKVFEKTEKGDVYSVFHGNVEERFYGKKVLSIVGSESPKDSNTTATKSPNRPGMETAIPTSNPEIEEHTWASKISSYTGSALQRVPSIYEETWASATTSKTNVSGTVTESATLGGVSSDTTVLGSVSESTTAVAVTETTTVSGAITSTTKAGGLNEMTQVGAMASTTNAGVISETTTTLNQNTTNIVALSEEVTLGAAHTSFAFVLQKMEIDIGVLRQSLALMANKLDVTIGTKVDILVGAAVDIKLNHTGCKVNDTQVTMADVKTSLSNSWTSLKTSLGIGP